MTMIIPRLFNAVIVGFVYSTLFFQLSEDDYASKYGLILNALMLCAFGNWSEMPLADEARHVVLRQTQRDCFFPTYHAPA